MFKPIAIFCMFFLISCGMSKEDKTKDSIDLALSYLSSDQCEKALQTLSEGADLKNAVYLQVLASAHACKGEVSSIRVIQNLMGLNSAKVFNEISTKPFALSDDLISFNFMRKALDVIFASTSQISQALRQEVFGKRKGQDLGMQGLLYSIVSISKFINYFGNTHSGEKGDGSGSNQCFLNYTSNPGLVTLLPTYSPPNRCGSVNDGHPELDLATALGRRHACQGITLMNNALDILETIEFGNSQEIRVIKDISDKMSQMRDFILTIDPSLESLFAVRDQNSCLDLSNDEIEKFIFAIYEIGFE